MYKWINKIMLLYMYVKSCTFIIEMMVSIRIVCYKYERKEEAHPRILLRVRVRLRVSRGSLLSWRRTCLPTLCIILVNA